MKFPSILFVVALLSLACNNNIASTKPDQALSTSADSASLIPVCLRAKIDSIKKGERWNPPTQIHEYELNGKKVYVTSAPCCDFFVTAVDANCNYICAPSGGFTGTGDRKCPDFFKQAKHIRLVWKDERVK